MAPVWPGELYLSSRWRLRCICSGSAASPPSGCRARMRGWLPTRSLRFLVHRINRVRPAHAGDARRDAV